MSIDSRTSSASSASTNVGSSSTPQSSLNFSRPVPTANPSTRKANVATDDFDDIKLLFDILLENNVPGPRLLRVQNEYNQPVGAGTEAFVYTASLEYDQLLQSCQSHADETLRKSAEQWRTRVVKQLRDDDRHGEAIKLGHKITSALSEVRRLCHRSLRTKRGSAKPGIVNLEGWALCLDSLEESFAAPRPRLPLLILEKAQCDMHMFINSDEYRSLTLNDIRRLSRDIGRGLSAMHDENIAHCDIKPSNVLVFKGEKRPWTAKICDFGSTLDASEHVCSKFEGGTPGWKPPEWYGNEYSIDPRKYDIFSYGLLVWAMFKGSSESPMSEILGRVGADQIHGSYGQQIFYHIAKDDISSVIPPGISWITQKPISNISSTDDLLSMSDSEIATPAQPTTAIGQIVASLRTFINKMLDGRLANNLFTATTYKAAAIADDYGPVANRILTFLSAALNEDPRERPGRTSQLIEYLELQRPYEDRVLPPARRRARPPLWNTHHGSRPQNPAPEKKFAPVKDPISRKVIYSLRTSISALRPRHSRLRTFEDVHGVFSDILGVASDEFYILGKGEHANRIECLTWTDDGRKRLRSLCYGFSVRRAKSWLNFSGVGSTEIPHHEQRMPYLSDDLLYALARIRSRFQPCCWKRILGQDAPFYASIEKALLEAERTRCNMIAAWALRTRTANDLIEEMTSMDKHITKTQVHRRFCSYFDFLFDDALSDKDKTFRIQLLLERQFHLGLELRNRLSVFQTYMERLRDKDMALLVCQYFRGMASANDATSDTKLYYSGHLDDSFDGVPDNDETSDMTASFRNTALHDAVKAGNYSVVEYLVEDGFNIMARDVDGRTSLEIAELVLCAIDPWKLPGDLFDYSVFRDTTPESSSQVDHGTSKLSFERILSLLGQRSPKRGGQTALPLYWKSFSLPNDVTGYHDLSINSEIHPITFREPRSGLLQDERLAIAQRESSLNQLPQVYWLNPIRFLRRSRQLNLQNFRSARFAGADTVKSRYSHAQPRNRVQKGAPSKTTSTTGEFNRDFNNVMNITIVLMESSSKKIFDEKLYGEDVRLTRNLGIEAAVIKTDESSRAQLNFRDHETTPLLSRGLPYAGVLSRRQGYEFNSKLWQYGVVFPLQMLWNALKTNYANILLVSVPLSLISRFTGMESTYQFVFSILAIMSLEWNVSFQLYGFGHRILSTEVRTFLSTAASLIPDLLIGSLAIVHLDISLPLWLIVGSTLCNNSLIPGLCFVLGGLKYYEQTYNVTMARTRSLLAALWPVFAIIVYVFWTTRVETAPSASANGVLSLSRGIALFGIFISSIWCLFRLKTHPALFDTDVNENDGEDEDEDQDDNKALFTPITAAVMALFFLSFLVLVSEAFFHSLQSKTTRFRAVAVLFVLPVVGKMVQHVDTIRKALHNQLDQVLDWTTDLNLMVSLGMLSFWVALGWVLQQPMSLLFDSVGTTVYALSSYIGMLVVGHGRVNFFSGVTLVSMYTLGAFGLILDILHT